MQCLFDFSNARISGSTAGRRRRGCGGGGTNAGFWRGRPFLWPLGAQNGSFGGGIIIIIAVGCSLR